ncbi:MAG: tetratricopeptide repeat protein [Lachnospiraceae bacterium]
MDKQEYKLCAEEIKSLIKEREFRKAMEIAEKIDWNRVRSVAMLCTVSDLYKINRKYKEAKELLLMAYDRHPTGRTIIYSLCELCIKTDDIVQAIECYKQFLKIAPTDSGKYILQYKIYVAQEVSLEEQIAVLEELKRRDYREKWGYELAYLYHRIGLSRKCIEECDELILWFSEGRYVTKAMELKMLHQVLTPLQQSKYELATGVSLSSNATEEKTAIQEETKAQEEHKEEEMLVKPMNIGEYDTVNLQKMIAEEMKEVLNENQEKTREIIAPMLDYTNDMEEVILGDSLDEILLEEVIKLEEEKQNQEKVVEERQKVEPKAVGTEMEKDRDLVLVTPPPAIAPLLSQEYDGQISLVVPEPSLVEKQITGQMNIEEVLIEWEKIKQNSEEKRKEEIKDRLLKHTGAMFSEFEEKIRDGILEKLEANDLDSSPTQELAEAVLIAGALNLGEKSIDELIPDESNDTLLNIDIQEEVQDTVQDTEELEPVEELEELEVEEELEELEAEEEFEESEELEIEESIEESEELEADEEVEEKIETSRDFTESERELFSPFVHTKNARMRFINALEKVSLAAYTGNIIVCGEADSNTIGLAKNILKEIQSSDHNFSGKIAKVTGNSLNSRNVESTIAKLNNGGLIIEQASGMNTSTVMDLLKALNQENTGVVVILEDNTKAIKKMLAAFKELGTFFNAKIEIESLGNDALVAYGKQYARHLEYSLDELAILALHTILDGLQTNDHVVNVEEVREIIDNAIANANRKTLKHFFDILLGRRYDEEDMIILTEDDFPY